MKEMEGIISFPKLNLCSTWHITSCFLRFLGKIFIGSVWESHKSRNGTDIKKNVSCAKFQVEHRLIISTSKFKALTKYERPKIKRDARQKCSLFLRKRLYVWWASLFIFGHSYFVRGLVYFSWVLVLNHMIYLKLRREELLCKTDQIKKKKKNINQNCAQ